MAILTVGPGGQFQTIAAAVTAAQNGDVVQVAAGTYTNDFVTITSSITLEAVGGMAIINATVPPPNGKAIITEGASGADITITGFVLTGAAVSDADGANGAGIRYEGGNLTLDNDYIFDNQDGILGNPAVAGTGTVTITNSEFADNGDASGPGSGYTHNIYIGNVATLSISNSLIIGAQVGHQIKSRALDTVITDNVIADGPTGTGSYNIDLPNGGDATITGNTIEKGPNAQNDNFISYGEEGVSNPGTDFVVAGNIFVSDIGATDYLAAVKNDAASPVDFSANSVYGFTPDQLVVGAGTADGTSFLATEPSLDTTPPWSGAAQPPQEWVPCFLAGTRIATPRGDVAVENLRIGDLVTTTVGAQPVKWIGTRSFIARLLEFDHCAALMPVRIAAGALADGVPARDLYVSPEHRLCFDDALIAAGDLLNGTTIARADDIAVARYFHVELPRHAVLYAEGAPAESYLDTGSRNQFANVLSYLDLGGDLDAPLPQPCLPTLTEGAALEGVRARLAARVALPDGLACAIEFRPVGQATWLPGSPALRGRAPRTA